MLSVCKFRSVTVLTNFAVLGNLVSPFWATENQNARGWSYSTIPSVKRKIFGFFVFKNQLNVQFLDFLVLKSGVFVKEKLKERWGPQFSCLASCSSSW